MACAIRASAVLVPLAASFASSVAIARVVPRPRSVLPSIAWWVVLLVVSTAVLVATERLARRVLPLAALLKLSLVFPDRAPSRFSFALRSGTTRQLRRRLDEYRLSGSAAAGASGLLALVAALNVHDPRTRGHSERVRALSDLLAEQLGLDDDDRERLHWAALLHDIGKLAVPAEILNKTGKPTDEEWEILKTHPDEGLKLVEGPIALWLGEWAHAIGEHHEKFDGSGYPKGLAGHQISLAGRLVAVADVFDVITATRSYKKPMTAQQARLELTRCAGTHFDPVMVRAFLQVSLGRIRKATGGMSWLAQLATLGRALPSVPAAAGVATVTVSVAAGLIPTPLAFAQEPRRGPTVEVGATTPSSEVQDPALGPTGGSATDAAGVVAAEGGDGSDGVPNGSVPGVGVSPHSTGEPTPPGSGPAAGDPADSPDATTSSTVSSAHESTPTSSTTPGSLPTSVASTPGLVIPPITIPGTSATLPGVSVTLPLPVALPPVVITVPNVPITLPVPVPPVTLPAVTIPPVTVPPVTVPPVTLPSVTLPPVTLPDIPGL